MNIPAVHSNELRALELALEELLQALAKDDSLLAWRLDPSQALQGDVDSYLTQLAIPDTAQHDFAVHKAAFHKVLDTIRPSLTELRRAGSTLRQLAETVTSDFAGRLSPTANAAQLSRAHLTQRVERTLTGMTLLLKQAASEEPAGAVLSIDWQSDTSGPLRWETHSTGMSFHDIAAKCAAHHGDCDPSATATFADVVSDLVRYQKLVLPEFERHPESGDDHTFWFQSPRDTDAVSTAIADGVDEHQPSITAEFELAACSARVAEMIDDLKWLLVQLTTIAAPPAVTSIATTIKTFAGASTSERRPARELLIGALNARTGIAVPILEELFDYRIPTQSEPRVETLAGELLRDLENPSHATDEQLPLPTRDQHPHT